MKFLPEVCEHLKCYVYYLVDPSTGKIFYVGKGTDNRVFSHAKGELKNSKNEDEADLKISLIRKIRIMGLEPIPIIHRHAMTSDEAELVEASLIDFIPGLSNLVSGKHSNEFGTQHPKQIIERYGLEVLALSENHNIMVVIVNRSQEERSLYDSVRWAWKVNKNQAKRADYILAVSHGVCRGVFVADDWLPATMENFPGLGPDVPGRHGFIGREAPEDIQRLYRDKRLPDHMIPKKGAANPLRYYYVDPPKPLTSRKRSMPPV